MISTKMLDKLPLTSNSIKREITILLEIFNITYSTQMLMKKPPYKI